MPAERKSVYPHMTAEEWAAIKAETPPAVTAARSVVVSQFGGSIPSRAFLAGENDHSAMMRGIVEFTTRVQAFLSLLSDHGSEPDGTPWGEELLAAEHAVHQMMEGPDGLRG